MKIDITKRAELNALLYNLRENTEAKWGLMNPQNMIEHLAKALEYSNGKKQIAQRTTEEEAKRAKEMMIYTDAEMPKGIKGSLAGEFPDPIQFPYLDEAKNNLNKELDDFETYFKNNPDASFIHASLGRLNYKEWIVLHSKHFTHHFKQFGLI